jgi:hypothetical protein
MSDSRPDLTVGRPVLEAGKVASATAVSAIPVLGPFLSGAILGAMQADTVRRLNASLLRLEQDIRARASAPELLVEDPVFRQAVAELYASVMKQERESKAQRLHAFITNHLSAPDGDIVVEEAILRALSHLPASHVEGLLDLLDVTHNADDLRDTVTAAGDLRYSAVEMVKEQFAGDQDQDHCGSAAETREAALTILFESLENAGLFRRSFSHDGPLWFELTDLGRALVLYCLPAAAVTSVASDRSV